MADAKTIIRAIKTIEQNNGIRILYACELGSRTWGFAKPDSDHDVKFVYTRTPKSYLGVFRPHDSLSNIKLDGLVAEFSGWDISKFCELTLKSNAQIYEWFRAPVFYSDPGFVNKVENILPLSLNRRAVAEYYLNMAKSFTQNNTHKSLLHYLRCMATVSFFITRLPPLYAYNLALPPLSLSSLMNSDIDWNEEDRENVRLLIEARRNNETVDDGLNRQLINLFGRLEDKNIEPEVAKLQNSSVFCREHLDELMADTILHYDWSKNGA